MDSFLTLGITVKMQAGINSIPACFTTRKKVKNPDSLGRKANLHFFSRLTNPLLPYTIRLRTLNLLLYPFLYPWLCQSPPIILYFPVKLTL